MTRPSGARHDDSIRRQGPAVFVVESGQSPIRSTAEYEEQLRKRLRAALIIFGAFAITLCATATLRNREAIAANPLSFFTMPPLPGVLLSVAIVSLVLVRMLATGRDLGLARLRAIEWMTVAIVGGFFAMNQTLSLFAGLAYDIRDNQMDLGAGLGAPWGATVLALGALAPSSARHCAVRTGVLVVCAFVPEMIAFPFTIGWTASGAVYLLLKLITIGTMSAIAIYGAYRIGVLRKDVRDARELGSYVLKRPLGSGGMGEVYLAEHRFLRRACAVKLIKPEQAGDEETLARFEREVRAAARLTHPNTVQIFDYGRAEDGTFYYAMEYLPGISLQELVDQHGPLPPARAVHILAQLCRALREAHAVGLVHRDIKPGNVMVGERGREYDVAKLLDFGLVTNTSVAEEDTKLTQAGMILGTPAYMSPEQCGGEADVTASSDIYSLGAVAYFLLTGASPFSGRGPMQVLAAHLYETPPTVSSKRSDIPESLSAVIARSLGKTRDARFADAEELERELLASLNGQQWTARDARGWWDSLAPAHPE